MRKSPFENGINHLVGYGSLVSHKSLKEDIGDKKFRKVIVKNYKRIFDIELTDSKKTTDILNVEKKIGYKFNGVMFKISKKEYEKLKKREDWYTFEETICYDFETGKKLKKAIISVDHHHMIDRYHKNPNKKYFILCREAAYHISKKFGEYWDKTTFTSTGKNIKQWIKIHREYDTINPEIRNENKK